MCVRQTALDPTMVVTEVKRAFPPVAMGKVVQGTPPFLATTDSETAAGLKGLRMVPGSKPTRVKDDRGAGLTQFVRRAAVARRCASSHHPCLFTTGREFRVTGPCRTVPSSRRAESYNGPGGRERAIAGSRTMVSLEWQIGEGRRRAAPHRPRARQNSGCQPRLNMRQLGR
jgi:hypothetical protein